MRGKNWGNRGSLTGSLPQVSFGPHHTRMQSNTPSPSPLLENIGLPQELRQTGRGVSRARQRQGSLPSRGRFGRERRDREPAVWNHKMEARP